VLSDDTDVVVSVKERSQPDLIKPFPWHQHRLESRPDTVGDMGSILPERQKSADKFVVILSFEYLSLSR
jgi:hypothetical protein